MSTAEDSVFEALPQASEQDLENMQGELSYKDAIAFFNVTKEEAYKFGQNVGSEVAKVGRDLGGSAYGVYECGKAAYSGGNCSSYQPESRIGNFVKGGLDAGRR